MILIYMIFPKTTLFKYECQENLNINYQDFFRRVKQHPTATDIAEISVK